MSDADVLIVGAGPAGMALALTLHGAGRRFLLVDARPAGAPRNDPRILALSHGSRQILERLHVWPRLKPTPIETIHVSQRGGFGRTLIHARDYDLPALGYVQDAAGLAHALEEAMTDQGIRWRSGARVAAIADDADDAQVRLAGPDGDEVVHARLVAYAEGAVGNDKDTVTRDYGQHAVLSTVTVRENIAGTAFERFTPGGPLALLPYGKRHALVFACDKTTAAALAQVDDATFLDRLQHQFGGRLQFTSATARSTFPLMLRYRARPVAARQVWLGNSAQTLHPVAGQGFNLALRDIWELAEMLRSAAPDAGDAALLQRYAAKRRLDRAGAIGFTDALVRIFSNDHLLLRIARGTGLLMLDLAPPARDFLVRRMIFGARAWP